MKIENSAYLNISINLIENKTVFTIMNKITEKIIFS